MIEITSSELPSGKFYKITTESERHYDMQYKTGVNTDVLPFNPSGECSKGGMYFFHERQFPHFMSYGVEPYWLREVTFTNNSRIWVEKNKYKTNEFILGERQLFYIPVQYFFKAVQYNGIALKYIPENLRSDEMCFAAVQQNGCAIQYVPDHLKTDKMCFAAVQPIGWAIAYVPDNLKNEKICFAAVQRDGCALRYVPDHLKTDKMCFAAVQRNGCALEYVPDNLKNEKICFAAVQQDGCALRYVPDHLKNEKMCFAAVQRNSWVLDVLTLQ